MNKKKLIIILLRFIPFLTGLLLFLFGIVNLFGSLFLFVGGYIAIRNILDYRVVKKNIYNIYELSSKHVHNENISNIDKKINYVNNRDKFYKDKVKVRKRVR